ncbi:MAG TPA: MFS transporter [Solirubrobacterales bacterium]
MKLSGRENALLVGTILCAVLPLALSGAVAVSLRHALGLSLDEFGLGVSAYYLSSACLSPLLGSLVQRLAPRDGVRIALCFGAASLLGLGLLTHTMATFFLFLAVGGVSNAIAPPAVNHFLTLRIDGGGLATAVGAKQAAVPIAGLLSGLSVPLVAVNFGWRAVFLLAAAAPLALLAGWTLDRRARRFPGGPVAGAEISSPRRRLAGFAVVGGMAAMGGNATSAFLVSSAVAIGFNQSAAALILAAGSAACAAVRYGGGVVVDRRWIGGMAGFAVLLAVGGLGYLGLASALAPVFAVSAILAFAGGWGWPGLFQFSVIEANPGVAARATGLTQTGVYLGAASGPLLFGLLATQSFALAWLVLVAIAFAASTVGARIASRSTSYTVAHGGVRSRLTYRIARREGGENE